MPGLEARGDEALPDLRQLLDARADRRADLALQHGAAKEARFETGAMHMGGTLSYYTSIKWLLDLFEKDADPAVVLQTLSFKPTY